MSLNTIDQNDRQINGNYQDLMNKSIKSKSGRYYLNNPKKLLERKPLLDDYYDILLHIFDQQYSNNMDMIVNSYISNEIDLFCPDNLFTLIEHNFTHIERYESIRLVKNVIDAFENVTITENIVYLLIANNYYNLLQKLHDTSRLKSIYIHTMVQLDLYSKGLEYSKRIEYSKLVDFIITNNIDLTENDLERCIFYIPLFLTEKLFEKYYTGWTSVYTIDRDWHIPNLLKWIDFLNKYNYSINIEISIFYDSDLKEDDICHINNITNIFVEDNCNIGLKVAEDGTYSEILFNVIVNSKKNYKHVICGSETKEMMQSILNMPAKGIDFEINADIFSDIVSLKWLLSTSKYYGIDISDKLIYDYNIISDVSSVSDLEYIYEIYGHDLIRSKTNDYIYSIVGRLLSAEKLSIIEYLISNGFPEIMDNKYDLSRENKSEEFIKKLIDTGFKISYNIRKVYASKSDLSHVFNILLIGQKYPEQIEIKYTKSFVDFYLPYYKIMDFYLFCEENNIEFKFKNAFSNNIREINKLIKEIIEDNDGPSIYSFNINDLSNRMKLVNEYTNLVENGKITKKVEKSILHEFIQNLDKINGILGYL